MLASDFARFVALARSGKPEPFSQIVGSYDSEHSTTEQAAVLRAQQRRHFEESFRYARETLGLGERGR